MQRCPGMPQERMKIKWLEFKKKGSFMYQHVLCLKTKRDKKKHYLAFFDEPCNM